MDPRPDDAIIYKYSSKHVLASLVVPVSLLAMYRSEGWRVLIAEDDLRRSDWFSVYLSEIAKWSRG